MIVAKLGARTAFLVGNGTIAIAHLALGLNWSFEIFLVWLFLSGVGVQLLVSPMTAIVSGFDPHRTGYYMSLVFLTIGFGIVATPLIAGWRLGAGDSWQVIVAGIGVLFVVLTIGHAWLGPPRAGLRVHRQRRSCAIF